MATADSAGGEVVRPTRARRRAKAFGKQAGWSLAGFVLVIAIWQIIVWSGVQAYILPGPVTVIHALGTYSGPLLSNTWETVKELLFGFFGAVLVGTPIAAGMAYVPVFEKLATPLLIFSQTIPKVALGPIFIVWIGIGTETTSIIALSIAVFPIIVDTAHGLNSIEPDMVRLGRSMGANRWRLFWRLRLPNALPSMFVGYRVGVTLALIGVIVGEFLAGDKGLGYLAISASSNQNTNLLFAAVLYISVIGVISYGIVVALERWVLRWHVSQRGASR